MRKRKPFYLLAGTCILIILLAIAYWTVLPRHGTIEVAGEGVYTGQLRGMIYHGYGTYESHVVGGTSYDGEWKNGVFKGQGALIFANGSKLVGEFVDGSIYGIGKSICPDGYVTKVDFGEGTHPSDCSGCGHDH